MSDFPIVIDKDGLVPQAPSALRALLVAGVAAEDPGYTANLPGSMIEDMTSTAIGAVALCDSARVETVDSLTPYKANAYLLNELGQIYGVTLNAETNTSVSVVFTGPPGLVIAQGFVVGDGTYQYVLQDGGVIGEDANSAALFALATQTGTWDVPAGSVTQLVTQFPSTVDPQPTVSNPQAGTPGQAPETEESYRARVLTAGKAAAQGFASYLRTLLSEVSGVQTRLIGIRQQTGGGWQIIVGGGDPYQVAYAIFSALFDVSTLVGSTLEITAITKAADAHVTTATNHNLSDGQVVHAVGVEGMAAINGLAMTVAVVDDKTFTTGINSSGFATYTGGGTIEPNPITQEVTLQDYPDTYSIEFVTPPQQTVAVTVTWDTTAVNFVSDASVSQLGAPAIVSYVNSIAVGEPIILYELQTVFQEAVASVLPPNLLTRMIFSVSINGTGVPPVSGTGIIAGDAESYFFIETPDVTITRG